MGNALMALVAGLAPRVRAQALASVDSGSGGWYRILESFAGAFQAHITVDGARELLANSSVFACVTVIATDIAKLRIKLVAENSEGICVELRTSPFLKVLRKPNRYQNRIKFIEQWIISKLLYGNTYVLKQRDGRGVVVALYILDASRVKVLVAEDGGVYYQLPADYLAGMPEGVTIPASEIIHDMMVSLWHPLVGVSPIYAAGVSATMGNRIQRNSTKFFDNMSRPSGQLTSNGTISDETAARLKKHFEDNFSGENIGRLMVTGEGLKYEAMAIPAQEAQLMEQLGWTVEDVARCFHIPLYKIGGEVPPNNTIDSLNQGYYSDCLQGLIESLELCLDEGLALPSNYYSEVDLDGLLRMDQAAMIKAEAESVKAGIKSPDESRRRFNLGAVPGGKYPYLQQQNYSLEALAKRDAKADPFENAPAPTKPAANDEDAGEGAIAALADILVNGLAVQ